MAHSVVYVDEGSSLVTEMYCENAGLEPWSSWSLSSKELGLQLW
jgi:hypothetical protein